LQCYREERQRNGVYKWVLGKTVSAKAADYSTYTKVTAASLLALRRQNGASALPRGGLENAATYSGYRY